MSSSAKAPPVSEPVPHAPHEDAIALASGTCIVALGVTLHGNAQILTGGTAGMAFLMQYGAGVPWWLGFFLINIPFYALAILRLGWKLTIRTVVAVCILSALARAFPDWLGLSGLNPVFSAVMGGLLIGVGLLILFRHRFSLGGVNLLALYAQERLGLNAGWVSLAVDGVIVLIALAILPLPQVGLSLLAAVVLNVVLATNHRPERYVGRS
jgi:uncharacterized membrane-anchored protein YitT (DUF2179 family)